MKDSVLPDVNLNLQVKDGYFSYPDLPKDVSDIQISLNVDYMGTDMDATGTPILSAAICASTVF